MYNTHKHVIINKYTKEFFKFMKKDNEIKNIYYEKIFDNNKEFFSVIIPLVEKFNKHNHSDRNKKDIYGRTKYLENLKRKLLSVYDFSYVDITASRMLEENFDLNFSFRKEQPSNSIYRTNPTTIQLEIIMSFNKKSSVEIKTIDFFFREEDPCGEITFDLTKDKIKYTIRHDMSIEVSYNNFLNIDFYCNELGFKNSLTSLFKIYPEQMLNFFFSGTRLNETENDLSVLQLDFDFNEVVGNDVDIPYVTNLDSKMNFNLIKKPFIKRLFKM